MKFYRLLDKPYKERFMKLTDTNSLLITVDYTGEVTTEKDFNSTKFFLDFTKEYGLYKELSEADFKDTIKSTSEIIQQTIKFVKSRHKNQVDKAGVDYFKHLEYVASHGDSLEEILVGYLHDIIEDTVSTSEEYSKLVEYLQGHYSEAILKAIITLTKKKKQSSRDYYANILQNELARKVKLVDLTHNSDLSRLQNVSDKDILRTEQYKRYIEFLKGN